MRDNPNDYRGRVRLADLLLANEDYVAAIAHLEVLESMMPSDGRISEKLHRAQILIRDVVSVEATPDE